MIGKLRGKIDSTDTDSLILDVNGVGYLVHCAARTIAGFGVGDAAELMIETHVREDQLQLFGFASATEREWFRLLGSVQGVGNKTALSILSAYTPEQMVRSILAKDIAAFKAISGIGPKLAERIVVELKDKVTKLPTSDTVIAMDGAKKKAHAPSQADDAISALVNLGYTRSDAYSAALAALEELGEKAGLDALIKTSLKQLVRK